MDLGVQLAVSAGLVLLMTVLHALGLVAISKMLRLKDERLRQHALDANAIGLLASFGLSIFVLHLTEIVIFALFYMAVGALQTLEDALFYSASAYATLGWTADFFPRDWRLIGALESLIGFILIGWSTAFLVGTMNKLSD